MKKLVIASVFCLLAFGFSQPSFAQCNQDTLRAWIENAILNSQNTLHDQLYDRITNAEGTIRAQLQDDIINNRLTLRAHLADDIINSRMTLRNHIQAHVDDATQSILDAIQSTCEEPESECPSPCDALRIEIERSLRDGKRIAKFYLPEPDGHLALTREIVVETIAAVQGSGESTNAAAARLAGADIEIAAFRYKRAWSFLSQAYFEAIKIVGESQ